MNNSIMKNVISITMRILSSAGIRCLLELLRIVDCYRASTTNIENLIFIQDVN